MANRFAITDGPAIVWGGAGADYALTLSGLANSTARQGEKGDLGEVRAVDYNVLLEAIVNVAPASGAAIELWWAASNDPAASSQNEGGCTGADAAYTGTAGDSIDDATKQLTLIGVLSVTSDGATVTQRKNFAFRPPSRYGMPVVVNKSGQALKASTAQQVVFTPRYSQAESR